ncbi:ribosome-associated translation inhibitor RaiA [Photobacterium sp. WH77]|uniref:Ribosome-associated translation inhibitor RaiA n=1 Tax=Photobacterium arenosum TaxID=2774143 RepID=A0ABR9BKN8_9GAMM|nr:MULTISPECIES: ribosome-associated translation inhibitor RaiA [Photobacterium]MBD8512921.1 ribosome-associated translation inhibitor RaiA [Photobacterium arenosum]MBV7261854.1 ribosome-associated translation inhibitor RaiA [Photobacterium sp. WH24]MCG2836752.1 ribosome-associated translation inhibitor RaiA [Photobacterium sp. WH77]MCG2844121.1 ribosome-associated translation inhibitor RaiA [Photobacterium sp. WH80]MDO6583734.1 ribosome-associated translation inhibitor RaiA [Photobacterium sp
MQVEVTGKNIDVTPAIRERIEEKFSKLERFQVPLIGKHAVISQEPNRHFKVEATAGIPGGNIVASSEQENMYAAIKDMYQKLERQLSKQSHKSEARRASHSQKPVLTEAEIAEEEDFEA